MIAKGCGGVMVALIKDLVWSFAEHSCNASHSWLVGYNNHRDFWMMSFAMFEILTFCSWFDKSWPQLKSIGLFRPCHVRAKFVAKHGNCFARNRESRNSHSRLGDLWQGLDIQWQSHHKLCYFYFLILKSTWSRGLVVALVLSTFWFWNRFHPVVCWSAYNYLFRFCLS